MNSLAVLCNALAIGPFRMLWKSWNLFPYNWLFRSIFPKGRGNLSFIHLRLYCSILLYSLIFNLHPKWALKKSDAISISSQFKTFQGMEFFQAFFFVCKFFVLACTVNLLAHRHLVKMALFVQASSWLCSNCFIEQIRK